MKKTLKAAVALALLIFAIPASATSYYGYARNWWVEENGDITYYLMNETNTAVVNGMCGSSIYRLKVGQVNYNELYTSILLAAKNNYRVAMEVTTCNGTVNVIKMTKVCTWTGDC